MHWSTRALLALTLLAGIGPTPVFAQRGKLDDHLQRLAKTKSGTNRVDVIVKVRGDSLGQVADKMRRRGDKIRSSHPSVEALAAEVRRDGLAALAADPAVERVSLDAPVTPFGRPQKARKSYKAPTAPAVNVLRETLGLTDVAYSGWGIGVAIIDSGIQPLADFDTRITAFRDFTKDDVADGRVVPAYDDYGHGTHIAGLIGSNGSLSKGQYKGVAPKARLIGLKVLDAEGNGKTSDVIAALEFAARNKAALGIDVVNLSLGHPIYEAAATDPLVQAVEKATRAGLVVVVAAGNVGENPETGVVGYAGVMSPGNAPSAITVGAVKTKGTVERSDDRIPDYSSRGPTWYDALLKPDVVAPGDAMVSNVARTAWLAKKYPALVTKSDEGGSFLKLSGTSMSTGVTSGAVALVLEAQRFGGLRRVAEANPGSETWTWDRWATEYRKLPKLSANTVKAVLQYSAINVASGEGAYDPLTQGAGAINAEGAVRLAYSVDVTAPLGTQWLSSFGDASSSIAAEIVPWTQRVYWGGREVIGPSLAVNELAWQGHVVWGTSTFWSSVQDLEHIVWGTSINWLSAVDGHIVWGTGLPFATSYLSDEHIVWGTGLMWDEHIVWGTSLVGLSYDEHIVWGAAGSQTNTVWGNLYLSLDAHIVWGTQVTAAGLK